MRKVLLCIVMFFSILFVSCEISSLTNTTSLNKNGGIVVTTEIDYIASQNMGEESILKDIFKFGDAIEVKKSFNGNKVREQVNFIYSNYEDLLQDNELKKIYNYEITRVKSIFKDVYNIKINLNKDIQNVKVNGINILEALKTATIKNVIVAEGEIVSSNSTEKVVKAEDLESISFNLTTDNIKNGVTMEAKINIPSYLWLGIVIGIIIIVLIILIIVKKGRGVRPEIPLE